MFRTALAAFVYCWSEAAAGYAQAHPCLPCHSREVANFAASPMGQSLSVPSNEPPGEFSQPASGSTVRVFWSQGVMHHQLRERGLVADYPMTYSIGAGKVGKSYLLELAGHLFQSPAAYYSAQHEWNASPGYESSPLLDFSRTITSDCLSCHAGAVKQTAGRTELTPISCDRCHGSAANHLRRPVPGSIVNPAKLPIRQRDSVCEQCHLEGATAVLNPDRVWRDFQPGEALEEVQTDYVYRTVADQQLSLAAVSQAEQLALSACLRRSNGKLWCGTCHDPHGLSTVDRKTEMRQICESCHAPAQLAVTHRPGQDDCVSCHMPSRAARDVSHAAITDHRISKRPAAVTDLRTAKFIVPWHEAKPEFAQRNLGLAFFNTGRQRQSRQDFEQAFKLLSSLLNTQDDAAVSAARGYMLLGSGQAREAVTCFELSTRKNPSDNEYWLDLAVAEQAAGNNSAAIAAFRGSIERNPYDYRPYKGLANLYTYINEVDNNREVTNEFLRLVPQSITMRLSK